MHGLGNDFIIVRASSWDEAGQLQRCSAAWCDRHFGIGADGLIVIGPDPELDIFMRIFNSDGSEAEMCGNGIRCVALYARQNGLVDRNCLAVRTLAGPRYPEVQAERSHPGKVRVDMGEPVLKRHAIPVLGEGSNVGFKLQAGGEEFLATAVSMGNPHCIVIVEDAETIPLGKWGPLLEKHQLFPAAANVEFVQVLNSSELLVKVWERGAGITLACGTGACASLVAAHLNGHTSRQAVVHLPGGDLHIEWREDDNRVYMSGPAVEVFKGQIEIE